MKTHYFHQRPMTSYVITRHFCGFFPKWHRPLILHSALRLCSSNAAVSYKEINPATKLNWTLVFDQFYVRIRRKKWRDIFKFIHYIQNLFLLYSNFYTLPVHDLFTFFLLALVYRCHNIKSSLPPVIYSMFVLNTAVHHYVTRSSSLIHMNHNFTTSSGSITCLASSLWNKLPICIRSSVSLFSFKKNLRLYYMKLDRPTWVNMCFLFLFLYLKSFTTCCLLHIILNQLDCIIINYIVMFLSSFLLHQYRSAAFFCFHWFNFHITI